MKALRVQLKSTCIYLRREPLKEKRIRSNCKGEYGQSEYVLTSRKKIGKGNQNWYQSQREKEKKRKKSKKPQTPNRIPNPSQKRFKRTGIES